MCIFTLKINRKYMVYHCSHHPHILKYSIYRNWVIQKHMFHLHFICSNVHGSNSMVSESFFMVCNGKTVILPLCSVEGFLPLMLLEKMKFYNIFWCIHMITIDVAIYISFAPDVDGFFGFGMYSNLWGIYM